MKRIVQRTQSEWVYANLEFSAGIYLNKEPVAQKLVAEYIEALEEMLYESDKHAYTDEDKQTFIDEVLIPLRKQIGLI